MVKPSIAATADTNQDREAFPADLLGCVICLLKACHLEGVMRIAIINCFVVLNNEYRCCH